ncbi:transposase [Streptomyces sp. NPDC002573]|uniref:IS66 family transposase n=1 Tax=Streptomyces sp. NPDC002573 TaxID=3364651 RepID=UPI0036CC8421
MDDFAILPAFTGTLVTDALASYTIYGDAQALCSAHVLRELIAVTEDTRRDPAWAQAMIDVLLEAEDAVAEALATGQHALAPAALTDFQDRYRQAALCGTAANPHPGTEPKPKARALAERLRDRTAEYQRYMTDFAVPFDNNAVERDLRMVKAQQKIAESWHTLTGARRFARIRSYRRRRGDGPRPRDPRVRLPHRVARGCGPVTPRGCLPPTAFGLPQPRVSAAGAERGGPRQGELRSGRPHPADRLGRG